MGIFDGLETLFSQTYFTTANAILKALNNRRFIYFCTLKLDFNVLKEQEKKAAEEREKEEKLREEEEIQWLEDMDEDEYDLLPDELKHKVDQKRLVKKKTKRAKHLQFQIQKMLKIKIKNLSLQAKLQL